jgi:hypothetical protein
MAASNRRKSERVIFERGIDAFIMGIDGTWRRDCFMEDVSQTGTKLTIHGSIEATPQRILPFAIIHRPGLPPLRAGLGQRRSDRRKVHNAA